LAVAAAIASCSPRETWLVFYHAGNASGAPRYAGNWSNGEIDVIFGFPARRREDARFLTGAGNYADDMNLPGQAYAYVVRSPHAHARIAGIDVGPAAGAPGVLAVLTGSDAAEDGLQPIPQRPVPTNPHEVPLKSSSN
jgi:hypothetical protein